MEKPPVLSDEQLIEVGNKVKRIYGGKPIALVEAKIAEAQRDADVEWYEGKIREIFEELYAKCSLEVQNIHSTCDMDRLVIRRGDWQALRAKYIK